MPELKVNSTEAVTINRLPCVMDVEDESVEVDMSWFDLTKRVVKDEKTKQDRTMAQFQGRPLMETQIDTEKLNLVLVKQDGDDLAQVATVEKLTQWRLQPDNDPEPLDFVFNKLPEMMAVVHRTKN